MFIDIAFSDQFGIFRFFERLFLPNLTLGLRGFSIVLFLLAVRLLRAGGKTDDGTDQSRCHYPAAVDSADGFYRQHPSSCCLSAHKRSFGVKVRLQRCFAFIEVYITAIERVPRSGIKKSPDLPNRCM